MTEPPLLKVYYDAVCPICRRERKRYEQLAGNATSVEWVDVTSNADRLRERGIDPQAALLSLHVEDPQGGLHDGIDAYILLMQRVPLLKPLAWLLGLPGLKGVLAWGYRHWVRRRLAREGREI